MNNQTIIQKSEKGWIIELPDEFAESIGIRFRRAGAKIFAARNFTNR